MAIETRTHMTTNDLEANKNVARRFIDGVFVRQDPRAVDELAAEDFTAHTFGPLPPGREPLKQAMARAGAGVSEARFEIHDMIAEDDKVAVRLSTKARHTGPFMGLEPTGKRYTIGEIHIFRIRDGQVTEHWHEFDKLALLGQLGGKPGA
jgi:ketosteroid isomerase-like protein